MGDNPTLDFGVEVIDAAEVETNLIAVNVTETTHWENGGLVRNKSITLPLKTEGLSHAHLIEILTALAGYWQDAE